MDMDYDGQRLLDVINDPNALESFLGDNDFGHEHLTSLQQQPAHAAFAQSPAVIPPSPVASSPLSNANVAASPFSAPSPAPSPGPVQLRRDSLSSTPVASPINYPPGPGPGSVQLPAGTITIPALATAVGQVQQLVSGGQVLQFLSTPTSSPQIASANVRHQVTNVRVKQPQLRPKPASTSSPSPVQSPVMSPRTSSPAVQSPSQPQQQPVQQPVAQTQPQVVQLGGPTGTLVIGGGNPVFPALAPTGGQFYLQQQSNGSFQLVVRPPVLASSPPRQPVVQPVVQPAVTLSPRPPVQPMAPVVRLVSLPGLGTVQLQQIQTPNGPAFLAVQQPQAIAQPIAQNIAASTAFVRAPQAFIQQQVQQPQLQQQQQQQQQQPQQQQQQQLVQSVQSPADSGNENSNGSFATPPAKKAPAKKKPITNIKAKKKMEGTEEKKPAVNLEELLKQTGIVGDEDFFMDDESTSVDSAPASAAQVPEPVVEAKENNVETPLISEANILQTLQQHGLALANEDLITLRNFIKPAGEGGLVSTTDSALVPGEGAAVNGAVKAKPTVSLTLGNGQVIQLTEPQPQFVVDSQVFQQAEATTNASNATNVNHGFQNEFLEDLARSQIVSDPKKVKKPTVPVNNNNNAKKKLPVKKKVLPGKSDAVTTATTTTTTTSSGARVQTIKLSPQNQQNLRNIQAQIQYLTSKKDPTPQETSLLQKLIEHHQNILATGKPVPTIPGQHAQGFSENDSSGTTVAPSAARSQTKVVPANIQQNTHLANLLRQPVADKAPRVTAQQTNQRQATPVQKAQTPVSSVTITPVSTPRFVVPANTQSSIQTPVGTILLTVVDGQAPTAITITTPANNEAVSESSGVSTACSSIPAVTASSLSPSTSATASRGVKRPAPKPTISKNTLFEHQLKTDQNGALTPDCRAPFTNKMNACKRLVRYHVFHELEPSPEVLGKEEDEFEERAEQLLSKFHQMVNKYHHLLLTESTKEAPASEYVMVERMFVNEEKQSLERLREEARVARELNLTPVYPVKAESGSTTVELVNGRRDSPCEDVKPKISLMKLRKDGEGYRSEIQEYKEIKCENGDATQDEDEANEAKPYDEWEAIQRELALYPDARGKDEDFDDDIKAQMQNAIDDLLKLNGCDEIATSSDGMQNYDGAYASLKNGDQFGGGDVQVDLALNEAVNSIL